MMCFLSFLCVFCSFIFFDKLLVKEKRDEKKEMYLDLRLRDDESIKIAETKESEINSPCKYCSAVYRIFFHSVIYVFCDDKCSK